MSMQKIQSGITTGRTTILNKIDDFPILSVIAAFAVAMFALQQVGISITYGIEILIFALAAYGVAFLFGYVDILSFGHAAFFGAGAYVTTYLLTAQEYSLLMAVLIALISVTVLAFVMGYLAVRSHGLYFAIITLAFAEIIYFTTYQFSDITGGDSGLVGLVIRPTINLGLINLNLNDSSTFFLVAAVVAIVLIFLVKRHLRSQLGAALIAVGQNEERARAIGYNTTRLKIITFSFSGLVTGSAGILYTIYLGSVTPSFLHWSISGDLILITIIGGFSSFFGPLVGAAVFIGLREVFSAFTARYFLFLGAIFILMIYYAPQGLTPVFRRYYERLKNEGVISVLHESYGWIKRKKPSG